MKKIYFLLIQFLVLNNISASNLAKLQEMRKYYDSFKPYTTDELMITVAITHKKNKEDNSTLDYYIVSYICSDNEAREMLEEELGKDDLVIRVGKDILSKTGK